MSASYWSSIDIEKWNAAMVGTFDTCSLASLVRWLHGTRRSALLRLESSLKNGTLLLRAGEISYASWGRFSGEPALADLWALPGGSFALFKDRIPNLRRNVHRGTAALLLGLELGIVGKGPGPVPGASPVPGARPRLPLATRPSPRQDLRRRVR